jgi:acetyl esterase/lipase
MILVTLRWGLLIVAVVMSVLGLAPTFGIPMVIDWRLRMMIGVIVGETGAYLAVLPICVGVAAWASRRGNSAAATATVGFCIVAVVLLLRPTAEAWRLGGRLPAQLAGAFGPVRLDRPAFSFAAIFARVPEPMPVETITYSNSLKLDFYRAVGEMPAPCVVAIHGGAWREGDRTESKAVRQCNDWLARHGYAVASIDYRLVPKAIWPAQRDDVLAALAYLRVHAAELGIDPARFVLLGRSAGGQLAEAVAYSAHDPGIRGVIAFYAPADMSLSWRQSSPGDSLQQRQILQNFLGGTPDSAPGAYESSSGALVVERGSPPTLLLHGSLDTIVPENQSELMHEKLAAAGVPHLLVSLPWATHGFDYLNLGGPGGQITTYSVEYFLAAVTQPQRSDTPK